jgi:hypothetical protein
MELRYDHKFPGLIVEVSESELKQLARELCEQSNQAKLLGRPIGHITYTEPLDVEQVKKRELKWLTLGGIGMLLGWSVFALGIYKVIEIVISLLA